MYIRVFVSVFLSVSIQCASYAQTVKPPLDTFASEGLGLLSPSESAALTSQINSGVHSAAKIQPFRASQMLQNYKTIFNSSAILANFPLSEPEQQKLNLSIDAFLAKSRRVSVATPTEAQSALYSVVSIRKNGDEFAILEVLVGVADWTEVKQKKADGPIPALVKSTVWVSISRRKLAWDAISTDGRLSFEKIEKDVVSLYRDSTDHLLLAF